MIRSKTAGSAFMRTQPRKRAASVRARVAAAFRNLAHGVDGRTAGDRMKDFYRSSGMQWARCLT